MPFSSFPEDAMVRIGPEDIRKKGKVPKNGSLFFTTFQTFMSGPPKDGNPSPYFGEYPPDFFDFIVIDECHRGGANDEGNWPRHPRLLRARPATTPTTASASRPTTARWASRTLRDFQDNEKSIPTILTTSQKLSTGVDARNIRNITSC
jgi:type I site-specific restriction endonuclease